MSLQKKKLHAFVPVLYEKNGKMRPTFLRLKDSVKKNLFILILARITLLLARD